MTLISIATGKTLGRGLEEGIFLRADPFLQAFPIQVMIERESNKVSHQTSTIHVPIAEDRAHPLMQKGLQS